MKFAEMTASVVGKGGVSERKSDVKEVVKNNNLSTASTTVLQHTFFALSAIEFFKNGREELYANDIRIKDAKTGREFSFNLTAKEVK